MRVLFCTQVFPPERHPSAIFSQELVDEMVAQGWQVTVATGFPNHPQGQLFPGFERKLWHREKKNGFELVRSWHFLLPSANPVHRGLMMVSQSLSFWLSGLFVHRPDIVICGAPPLVGPLTSTLMAKAFGAKSIQLLFDIYPDIPIDLGLLSNPVLIGFAKSMERTSYKWSDHIVVISEGFRHTLINEKHLAPEKISVIPLWLDPHAIIPLPRVNDWRLEMGIPAEKFVALYAGTIGFVSGAEVILRAAQALQDYPDILFLMVGDGHAKEQAVNETRRLGLKNLQFLPFQSRERLSELQATADVSLVTLAPGRGRTSVPSKVLGYMAAARPIVAGVDLECDTADLIRRARCGLVVPPGRGNRLAEEILHLYRHPQEREELGNQGRSYFMKNLQKGILIQKYIDLIESLYHQRK